MKTGDLEGQVALVTGGSRGIGRAIALELARKGADVVVNYRRERDAAEKTAAEIRGLGRRAVTGEADVADFEAVARLADLAVRDLGGIDIVVANSGVASRPASVATMDVKEWHRVIGVNLHGAFYTCRACVPKLLERKRGCVILISSIGADSCAAFGAPYYAAKAGVNALTKVLARELAAEGIRVNAIAPGLVSSDMGERMARALGEETLLADIPLGRAGTPEEIGKLAAYLASLDAAWITGQVYRINGGAWM
ncbi:MAG: SDR family oxidoreductase [Deltaproteobacteria bacterium]|nr:SDR family oxidoreductase [Deltaproteobacteria bacterium]